MLSGLAAFFVGIINGINYMIKSYDLFFEAIEDYLAKNIKNGRIFYDIGVLEKKTYLAIKKSLIKFYKSKPFQDSIAILVKILKKITSIPIVDKLLSTLKIVGKSYSISAKSQIFVLFIIFPLITAIIFHFNTSLKQFFIYSLPFSIIILYFETGLCRLIYKLQKNEKTSLLKELTASFKNFYSVVLIFLMYFFILNSFLYLIINLIALSFEIFPNTPSTFNLYLSEFGILYGIFLILFLLFYISVLSYHAFYIAVLENGDPIQSFTSAYNLIKRNYIYLSFYTGLFLISSSLILVFTYYYLSDFALLWAISFIIHFGFLYFYGQRRIFITENQNAMQLPKSQPSLLFTYSIILITGVLGYITFVSFSLNHYPSLITYLSTWEENRNLQQNFKLYNNRENSYSIYYPSNWTLTKWKEKITTFTYNINNTSSGVLNINIETFPISESDFFNVNFLKPGSVIVNLKSKEKIENITKIIIDGKDAIKYNVIKETTDGIEYETNYLIARGDSVIKITYSGTDLYFLRSYQDKVNKMIDSFRFTSIVNS